MARRRKGSNAEDGVVPGFTDVTPIGNGRLSSVFRAVDVENHRPVALKVLDVEGIPRKALARFQKESLALGTLGMHPNVVTLLRTLTLPDGRIVQVLELCEGSVAQSLSPDHALDPALAIATTVKVAGAAEAGHRAGLVHQDLTPRHVRITVFGEPAVADYGLAELHALSPRVVRTAADMAHTPPEWLDGAWPNPAGDVYQLASMLFSFLKGSAAFAPVAGESPAALTVRILEDPAPILVAPDLPIAVADLIARCLSKDPTARLSHAGAFAEALRAIEADHGWAVTPVVTAGGSLATATSAARVPLAPPAAPPIASAPMSAGTADAPKAGAPASISEPGRPRPMAPAEVPSDPAPAVGVPLYVEPGAAGAPAAAARPMYAPAPPEPPRERPPAPPRYAAPVAAPPTPYATPATGDPYAAPASPAETGTAPPVAEPPTEDDTVVLWNVEPTNPH